MTKKTRSTTSAVVDLERLTEKQRAYVDARGRGKGRRSAAAEAGYADPENNARQVERLPQIQAAIDREHANTRLVTGLKRSDIVAGIQEAIEQAKMLADPTAQIAGWRELAKMHGYYAPEVKKIEIAGNLRQRRDALEALTDEQLLEIVVEDMEVEGVSGAADGE